MKNKVFIIILISLLMLTGCNASTQASTISHMNLSAEENELVYLVSPETNNAFYEFELYDIEKIELSILVYHKGEFIQEKIMTGYMKNEISSDSGKICLATTAENNITASISSKDMMSSCTLNSQEIDIPADDKYSLTIQNTIKDKQISADSEVTLLLKAFESVSDNGICGINLSAYTTEDIQRYEYCYLIKCRFS